MEELFLRLLNVSITAGWLVLAIIALRLIFRKAPRWMFCVLWALVGVRLILPFSIESVFSLIPSVETVPQEIFHEPQPTINSGFSSVNNVINPIISDNLTPTAGDSVNPAQIYSYIAGWVWAAGLAVMLSYAFISWLMLKNRVRTATLLRENIRQSEAVDSPFVLGVIRPQIYLPYNISEKDANCVIEHERAHISRGDHLIKPLGFLLLSVYWFNPLMWAAYILLCRDIELACDEKVIRTLDKEQRREYSAALLGQSIGHRRITACPLAFGEVGVKERVKSVINYKKPAFWVMIIAVLACVVTAVCFLTDPAGIKLTQLEDCGDYETITEDITYVELHAGADIEVISDSDLDAVFDFVENIRISRTEISQNRSDERDSYHKILLLRMGYNGMAYKTIICISTDFTELWINNDVKPTLSYRVMNPEKILSFFAGYFSAEQAAVTSDIETGAAYVGYSHNGSLKLTADALNQENLVIRGGQHIPIIKISSTAELEAFCKRYSKDMNLSDGVGDIPSFDELCINCDDSFFDKHTLFVVAVIQPSAMTPYNVKWLNNKDGRFQVLVEPAAEADDLQEIATWFVTVEVDNEYIAGCSSFDAQLGTDWVDSVNYVCKSSIDWETPELTLFSDNRFSFVWSLHSSYIAWGEYSIDGEYLMLKTDDGLYEYTFRLDGDSFVFVESMSSPIPTYSYAPDGEPQSPVNDGSVFKPEYHQ